MVDVSMLRYAAIAAVGALSVAGVAQVLIGSAAAKAAVEAPLRGAQGSEPEAGSVAKSPDGHFWAEGVVDGLPIHFLVDTGASSVSLTPLDAQRLGLDPAQLIYDQPVRTAAGEGLAARVRLDSVSVSGVRIRDVDALVIGRGLPASLLGMSYLGRLARFEATPSALVLQR